MTRDREQYEAGWRAAIEAAAQVVVARGFRIPSLAKLADKIRSLAPPHETVAVVAETRCCDTCGELLRCLEDADTGGITWSCDACRGPPVDFGGGWR